MTYPSRDQLASTWLTAQDRKIHRCHGCGIWTWIRPLCPVCTAMSERNAA